ncbi:chromosome segregation protein SMC [Candidatus Woesearchaeota archaeon]|nr:chromosome segregation protein SMC [Candidatus Woesearchaeota archaeon]
MTRILKLSMKGFKSFAQRTDIVFGEKFNCVLGPNGSGKSNVIDAICFVLGKASAKGLRAEKQANLIYNGGKTKQPAKEGEVSIYFDNSGKTFPSEEKEIKISRIVRSDGVSVYKINDKARTRQQILDLLSIARIDPDGYNIILQGDIVRFVEMSTVERRGIVEEIAGISIYEEKKLKAIREFEKVEARLNEAEIILSERKTYLEELKKECSQAKRYKDLEGKVQASKATLIHMDIGKREAEKRSFDEKMGAHADAVKKLEAEIARLKEEVKRHKKALDDISKEVEEKGEKDQVRIHKELEQIRVEIGEAKNRIAACDNEVARVDQRKGQLDLSLAEIREKLTGQAKELEGLERRKKQIEREQAELQKRIDAFKDKNNMASLHEIEQELDGIEKAADEKQHEIAGLREEQQELLREKDKLEFQLAAIDERVAKVLELEKEHKDELLALKQKRTEFKKAAGELSKLLNESSSLAAQAGNIRAHLQAASEDFEKLSAKRAGIQERIAGGIAVQKILGQKGSIRGIHGAVTELGNVPARYSLALEVAAGPKIASVVVEDDRVAVACISFLKKNRFGTATFLPLNKIKPVRPSEQVHKLAKGKGVHGFATDLMSFQPKYKNVFSYVFGSTLVVDDLTVARRIGIGLVRMVTLDGDLAEVSGAMQGGFRQKAKGLGFQEKETAEQLKRAEEKVEENQRLLSILMKRKDEVEERIVSLREFKANLEGEIIKTEKGLHLDTHDLDASKLEKRKIAEQARAVDRRIGELQQGITATNAELAQTKIRKQQVKGRISELRNPAVLAELNTFEEKRSELREELAAVNADIKNIASQRTGLLQPEMDRIAKVQKGLEKEKQGFSEEKKALQEGMAEKRETLMGLEEKEKEFYAKYKDLFAKRNEANDLLQKAENAIILKEEQARGEEHRINAIGLENARVEAELAGLREGFRKYEGVELLEKATELGLKRQINEFERLVEQMGTVNLKALEVYDNVEKEYTKLTQKREKLMAEKDDVLLMMNEIEAKKKGLFMKTFAAVNEHFQKIFSALSTKGDAYLELETPETPFEGGMGIKVRITSKKFMDIRSLSGGEKTMTALAFIFAIQEFEPASFYVLDEVDAALDKRNSEKLAALIRRYVSRAQYVIISHNDGVISEADNLYGVSMNELGMSKVVSLRI